MTLEEQAELMKQMAKDIAELKAHLVPKPDSIYGSCQHEYPSGIYDTTTTPICVKCSRPYVYQGR